MEKYTEKDRIEIYKKVRATLDQVKERPLKPRTSKKSLADLEALNALSIPAFSKKLEEPIKTKSFEILQVNLGYLCNQVCIHCHVNAGPSRKELMTKATLQSCLNALDNGSFHTVDLTGGAPEIHPEFKWFVGELSKRNVKVIVRSNLTILTFHESYYDLPEFFAAHRVEVIASMPCYTLDNVDKQRGEGVFDASIDGLKRLNEVGYGRNGSGLELHLVYNPGGAFLPGSQEGLERDYKKMLSANFGIVFNKLYTITNMPISRFLIDLKKQDKLADYMHLLVTNFNLSAVENVMCRNTISVKWDGTLYDCDFNQMLDLPVQGKVKNIDAYNESELRQRNVVVHNHCYGCTAGAGSSCQGAIS